MTEPTPSALPEIGTSRRTIRLVIKGGAASAVVAALVQVALLPFVLGRLGPDLYGTWLALAAILGVAALADAGIRTEVTRRVAAAHGRAAPDELIRVVHNGVSLLTLLVVPVVVAGALAAPHLVRLLFVEDVPGYTTTELATMLRWLMLVVGVSLVLGTHLSALRGVQRSDAEAVGQIAGVVVNAVTTVLGIVAGLELWSLFAGYTAGSVTLVGVQWIYARRLLPGLRFRFVRFERRAATAYLSLSALALMTQVADVVDSQWDKFVLSHYVGPEAVTSFHVGTSLLLQAKALTLLPLFPILVAVAEWRSSSLDRAEDLQVRLMKAGAVLSSVLMGGAFVFLPSFIRLWLGPGYEEAGDVARIFAFSVVLTLAFAPLVLQALAEGLHVACALSAGANMVVNASLSLVLTMQVGLLGAVYGSLAGTVSGVVVFYALARRRLSYWPRPPMASLALTSCLAVGLIAVGLDEQETWTGLILAAVGFTVVVGCLGAFVERIPLPGAAGPFRSRKARR